MKIPRTNIEMMYMQSIANQRILVILVRNTDLSELCNPSAIYPVSWYLVLLLPEIVAFGGEM